MGDQFALEMLTRHNEKVEDPNDPQQLETVLTSLGVPAEDVRAALEDETRSTCNEQRTQQGSSMLTHGGVPEFFVRVPGGRNLMRGSAVHPSCFEDVFNQILNS